MAVTISNITEPGNVPIRNLSLAQTLAFVSVSRLVAANTTNATLLKGGPAVLLGVTVTNAGAAARYVKTYNKATAPTVGTDVPVQVFGLAAGVSQTYSYPNGYPYSIGLGFGIVNLPADSDTTAPTAGDVIVDFHFL